MSVAKKRGPKPDGGSPGEGSKKPAPAKPDQMSSEVIEFIQAIDEYKRLQQRPFPSWSEVLEVLKSLGYSKSA